MKKQMVLSLLFCGGFALVSSAAIAAPPKSTPQLIEQGKKIYTTNCATCHGEKGDGNGPAGAMLNPKPRNFATEKFKKGDKPQQVFDTVTKGLEGTTMAPFGYLPENDRWAVSYYVLSMRKGKKK